MTICRHITLHFVKSILPCLIFKSLWYSAIGRLLYFCYCDFGGLLGLSASSTKMLWVAQWTEGHIFLLACKQQQENKINRSCLPESNLSFSQCCRTFAYLKTYLFINLIPFAVNSIAQLKPDTSQFIRTNFIGITFATQIKTLVAFLKSADLCHTLPKFPPPCP